jgi:hypothetical protein
LRPATLRRRRRANPGEFPAGRPSSVPSSARCCRRPRVLAKEVGGSGGGGRPRRDPAGASPASARDGRRSRGTAGTPLSSSPRRGSLWQRAAAGACLGGGRSLLPPPHGRAAERWEVADGALGRGPRAKSARPGRLEARWIWRPGARTGLWRPTCRPPVQPKKRQKRPAGRFGGPFQAPCADSHNPKF